ncbi:hypothetical protein M3J09_010856 [Ascochyta lentis]
MVSLNIISLATTVAIFILPAIGAPAPSTADPGCHIVPVSYTYKDTICPSGAGVETLQCNPGQQLGRNLGSTTSRDFVKNTCTVTVNFQCCVHS